DMAPASCIGRQPAARRSEAESSWHGVNEPVDMAPASCIGRQPAARRSEAESSWHGVNEPAGRVK
ncbi:hypothetical protein, partial [Extibacter muris]